MDTYSYSSTTSRRRNPYITVQQALILTTSSAISPRAGLKLTQPIVCIICNHKRTGYLVRHTIRHLSMAIISAGYLRLGTFSHKSIEFEALSAALVLFIAASLSLGKYCSKFRGNRLPFKRVWASYWSFPVLHRTFRRTSPPRCDSCISQRWQQLVWPLSSPESRATCVHRSPRLHTMKIYCLLCV